MADFQSLHLSRRGSDLPGCRFRAPLPFLEPTGLISKCVPFYLLHQITHKG